MWCHGVVVISTAQLHSTKPEVKFCAGSNPTRGVSEICHGEDLWQCSRLKIRLNAFRWSNLPQKQFIIINNPRFCKFFLYFFNSCLSISFTCVMQMVYIIRIACSWRKVLNFLTISSFNSYCYLIFFEVCLAFTIDTSWLVSFWLIK